MSIQELSLTVGNTTIITDEAKGIITSLHNPEQLSSIPVSSVASNAIPFLLLEKYRKNHTSSLLQELDIANQFIIEDRIYSGSNITINVNAIGEEIYLRCDEDFGFTFDMIKNAELVEDDETFDDVWRVLMPGQLNGKSIVRAVTITPQVAYKFRGF